MNVFLDELLWLVLSSARSFSTDRLKTGLNKALPTALGKEALLEAEVELRAYWEKAGAALYKAIEATPVPPPSEFPLQAAFEVPTFCHEPVAMRGGLHCRHPLSSCCATSVKPTRHWANSTRTRR